MSIYKNARSLVIYLFLIFKITLCIAKESRVCSNRCRCRFRLWIVSPFFCCAAAGRFAVTAVFVLMLLFFAFCSKLSRASRLLISAAGAGYYAALAVCVLVIACAIKIMLLPLPALDVIFSFGDTTKIFLIPTCGTS